MLETQFTMDSDVAKRHYLRFRELQGEQRQEHDDEIQRSYLELSRGRSIINAEDALLHAGLGPDGRPRLAFCRADAKWCYGRFYRDTVRFLSNNADPRSTTRRSKSMVARLPGMSFVQGARTIVPTIPPAHRPASRLENYWIMWEVADEGWEEVPTDPALLKRLNSTTFSVLAVWDLTEVERMVLRGVT